MLPSGSLPVSTTDEGCPAGFPMLMELATGASFTGVTVSEIVAGWEFDGPVVDEEGEAVVSVVIRGAVGRLDLEACR